MKSCEGGIAADPAAFSRQRTVYCPCMKRRIWLTLCLLAAISSAQGAVTVLVPIRDNTIYAEDPGQSNGAGEHLFAGRNAMNQTRRGLLAFDVAAAIPAGSTITAVSLQMYCTKATPENGPQAVRLHRLLKSWGESSSDGGFEEGMGGPAQTEAGTGTNGSSVRGCRGALRAASSL